ncbi:MAG: pyrrolo-quinoline quinone, partial [Acidobacteria bacterium]|nr:pyrrolo-quinoline quinone [Acidobacteriota bacterium]
MYRCILLTAVLLASQAAGAAGNWPHWRGPNMNGLLEDENLPVSWSATENIAWKLEMPDFTGS